MPYIVTTKRPTEPDVIVRPERITDISCRAVATLEEARVLVGDAIYDAGLRAVTTAEEAMRATPESGGTLDLLIDGTVIEVEAISHTDERLYAGYDDAACPTLAECLATFNADPPSSTERSS